MVYPPPFFPQNESWERPLSCDATRQLFEADMAILPQSRCAPHDSERSGVDQRGGAEEAEDVAVLSQSVSAHEQTGPPQNNTMEDRLCRLYMQTKKITPLILYTCKRLWSMMLITVMATLSSLATRWNDYRLLASASKCANTEQSSWLDTSG